MTTYVLRDVMRLKVCHCEILKFNNLENIATHDDKKK